MTASGKKEAVDGNSSPFTVVSICHGTQLLILLNLIQPSAIQGKALGSIATKITIVTPP